MLGFLPEFTAAAECDWVESFTGIYANNDHLGDVNTCARNKNCHFVVGVALTNFFL